MLPMHCIAMWQQPKDCGSEPMSLNFFDSVLHTRDLKLFWVHDPPIRVAKSAPAAKRPFTRLPNNWPHVRLSLDVKHCRCSCCEPLLCLPRSPRQECFWIQMVLHQYRIDKYKFETISRGVHLTFEEKKGKKDKKNIKKCLVFSFDRIKVSISNQICVTLSYA